MTEATLYREFILSDPNAVQSLWTFLKSNVRAFIDKGSPLHCIVAEESLDRLDYQIAFYFGPFMRQVCANAWVEGRQFDKDTWHVFFARKFLPSRDITMPDGTIETVRGSVARGKIGMKAMAKYQLECEAYCSTELGIEFNFERQV